MRRNKLFYMKTFPDQNLFVPSEVSLLWKALPVRCLQDIVEFYSRAERERRFVEFIDTRFKYGADGEVCDFAFWWP